MQIVLGDTLKMENQWSGVAAAKDPKNARRKKTTSRQPSAKVLPLIMKNGVWRYPPATRVPVG